MNELKIIKMKPGVIETNFKEFKEKLVLALEDYKGLVVTQENSKEMNSKRLEISKGKKIIIANRIEQKKKILEPFNYFENECDEAIELMEEVENELKAKVDHFDEITRQAKRDYAIKTAIELATSLSLELDYQNRIDVEKDSFVLKGTKEKDILKDLIEQTTALENLQKAKHANKEYVVNQLVTASKLAGLSTPLVNDDISHLISDYETMDILKVTEGITSVAMRRKESEELAVKQAEERIRLEEQRKAEAKERAEREKILAAERKQEELRREEAEKLKVLEQKELNKTIISAQAFEHEPLYQIQPEHENNGFVSLEEAEEVEAMTILRVYVKKSQIIDVIRLLAINDYDCEVEE